MADSSSFILRFAEPRLHTPLMGNALVGLVTEPKPNMRQSSSPPGTMTVTEAQGEAADNDPDSQSYYTIPLRGYT